MKRGLRRRGWIGVCLVAVLGLGASAEAAERDAVELIDAVKQANLDAIAALLDSTQMRPDFTWLRAPEMGSVMVRGRIGGTGDAFNLGEMTVTRCALKLLCGTVGHGYVQGRRKPCAEAQGRGFCGANTSAGKTGHNPIAPIPNTFSLC